MQHHQDGDARVTWADGAIRQSSDKAPADRSWWLDPKSRDEFDRAAAAERNRIAHGRYGDTGKLMP